MQTDSLQRMLEFLLMLKTQGIHYRIEQTSPDAIMVFFTVVGGRAEVEFFVGGVRYKAFTGSEDVLDDMSGLLRMITQ